MGLGPSIVSDRHMKEDYIEQCKSGTKQVSNLVNRISAIRCRTTPSIFNLYSEMDSKCLNAHLGASFKRYSEEIEKCAKLQINLKQ